MEKLWSQNEEGEKISINGFGKQKKKQFMFQIRLKI